MATARTLLLDDSGDLALVGGSFVVASDGPAVVQAVRCLLLTFQGEYFLDLDYGIPYFEQVLVKNPRLPAVAAMLRERLLSVAGVREVLDLRFDYLSSREAVVAYVLSTDFGELRSAVEVNI